MTVEKLQNDCYDLLVAMKEDTFTAKQHTTNKRETKEKLLPLLRALKTKLSRQGKKDGVDGWTAWFNENKEDFGISLRTADRWIDPAAEKPKFANLDKYDGVIINGRKFDFKIKISRDRIVGLDFTPVVVPEKSTAIENEEPILRPHEISRQKRLDEAQAKQTTHKMSPDGKRTFCGKRPGSMKDAQVSDTPTCRNCQNGEQRHNDNVAAMKEGAEAVGYEYDEKTGIAKPKQQVTVVISEPSEICG